MTLHARFGLVRGTAALDVDLVAAPGETVALLGPNGAGKTSCLLAIAGLLRVERGSIGLGDEVFDGGPGGAFVPPERRGVGMVFQEHLLFPHLDALGNVAFGPRSRGVPRRVAEATARDWLARVGLLGDAARLPAQLSGGQAQRVALARALASAPRILLLDEPLAAADATTRVALRRELAAHLRAFAGVRLVVAHDTVDAFALADRIVVLEQGRIVQTGTVTGICSRPRTRYVADLVGLNLVRGTARAGVVACEGGGTLVVAPGTDGPVLATVHPRAVSLFPARPEGSPRNVWEARVAAVEPSLDRVRVRTDGAVPLVAEITPAARAELGLDVGARVWVAVKATEIAVAPA